MKRLIVFALNGALADGRMPIDPEMAELLRALNEIVKVAVISGVDWSQCESQVLAKLTPAHPLHRLTLLPAGGTQLYRYSGCWGRIYSREFSPIQKDKIVNALERAVEMMNFDLSQIWGPLIEDRGSQVTYSGLGQLAPVAEKRKWDPDCRKRRRMKMFLDQFIPEYSVHLGGMTSIDVTKPGLDKGYGIRQLRDGLGIPIQEMLFIGNTSIRGGNDLAAKAAGIQTIEVRDHDQTKPVIEVIIAMLSPAPASHGPTRISGKLHDDRRAGPQNSDAPLAESAGGVLAAERHAALAQEIRRTLARYAELMEILACCEWGKILPEARLAFADVRGFERFLPDCAPIGEPFAGLADRLASLQDAMDGCERIMLSQIHGAMPGTGLIGDQDAARAGGAASS